MQLRYAFRLYPEPGQRASLARAFGCARVVFNDAVRVREDARKAGGALPTAGELSRKLITEAKRTEARSWLGEVSSVVLQQSLRDAEAAYKNFFASLKGVRKGAKTGAPRFKSRKDSRQSIRFTANARWSITASGRLKLPKIGAVKVKWSRTLPAQPSSVTAIKDAAGRYFASFVTPENGHFSVVLQPGHVYSLTTTTGQGRGHAVSPPQGHLALPYSDSFERNTPGREAKYLSDMQGSFETARCGGRRPGRCVRQTAAQQPIEWQDDSDAFALLGDTDWKNYTVSSDVHLEQPGTVELIGRAGEQQRPQSHQAGYFLRVGDTGAWSVAKSDTSGLLTTLADGTTRALGTHRWHRLGLSFSGTTITASIDGRPLGAVDDSTYSSGQVGIGVAGYRTDEFDNLGVTPVRHPAEPPATLAADLPSTVHRGESATLGTTFTVPASGDAATDVILRPGAPAGWTVTATTRTAFSKVAPGHSVTASWTVTAPTASDTPVSVTFSPLATYVRDAVRHWTYGTAKTDVPIPPPTGNPHLSDLSFVSGTNGWGPVERDTSNGEQAAGDGQPITIRGTVHDKGLGTHADSDVAFFLGGACGRFTATVGIDDEVAPYGSVTFSVTADGRTLATTPVLTGTSPPLPLDIDVSGAQQLRLVVSDAGDGNAHDHADWADARLDCTG